MKMKEETAAEKRDERGDEKKKKKTTILFGTPPIFLSENRYKIGYEVRRIECLFVSIYYINKTKNYILKEQSKSDR